MSPLLAPVLAQIVSLQLADRTEARYLDYEDDIYEASTSPSVQLSSGWKRSDVTLSYSPSLTLSPLEEQPRTLAVYHSLGLNAGYRWRRSSLTLASYVGFGTVNFQVTGLRGQPPPLTGGAGEQPPAGGEGPDAPEVTPPGPVEPTPGDPSTGQIVFSSQNVRYYSTTTTLSGTHAFTKRLQGQAHLGQTRAGGLDSESAELYPPLHAYFAGVGSSYTLTFAARDSFVTSASLDGSVSSFGSTAITLNAQEGWNHTFDPRTFTGLSAGINITRFTEDTGLRGFGFYPSFTAWISHTLSLWGGALAMGFYSYSGPTFDPLRAIVDPRFGVGASLGYTRKRFATSVSGGAAISINSPEHDVGSIDNAQASAVTSYQISDAVSMDGGVRYWRQRVEDVEVVPASWSVFVGLSLGHQVRLLGGGH